MDPIGTTHLSIGVDGRVDKGRRLEPCVGCISTFDYLNCDIYLFAMHGSEKVISKIPKLYLQVRGF